MPLPFPEYFTYQELQYRWRISREMLDRYICDERFFNVFADLASLSSLRYVCKEDVDIEVILGSSVERFEREHGITICNGVRVGENPALTPDTTKASEITTEPDFERYLDLQRDDLPEELRTAIESWLYVQRLDTPPAEFKKELRRVLVQKGITGEANERIATVANPHKKAGTPKRIL